MVKRSRVAKGWLAVSLLAAYACAGRSMERDDGGEAGASNASFAGRGGAGGTSSGRGGYGGTNTSKGGSGAFAGTIGLDGGSAGRGGSLGTAGGAGGSAGAPELIGGWGGEAGPAIGGVGGRGEAFACRNPRSADGGYILCESDRGLPSVVAALGAVEYGYVHRPVAGVCQSAPSQLRARAEGGRSSEDDVKLAQSGSPNEGGRGGSGNPEVSCESDADCGERNVCSATPLNYCGARVDDGGGAGGDGGDGGEANTCRPGCVSDADCGAGFICLCGSLLTIARAAGACVPATCRTDADCEPGYRCASAYGDGYALSFSCQTPDDECATHDECDHLEAGASAISEECRGGSRRRCGVVWCGQ